jgi:hypothetical protein
MAVTRAFSPNPKAPIFDADLPSRLGADSLAQRNAVLARCIANTPTYLLSTHTASLRQLRALAFDGSAQDKVRHIRLPAKLLVIGCHLLGLATWLRNMRESMEAVSWATKDVHFSMSYRFSTGNYISAFRVAPYHQLARE